MHLCTHTYLIELLRKVKFDFMQVFWNFSSMMQHARGGSNVLARFFLNCKGVLCVSIGFFFFFNLKYTLFFNRVTFIFWRKDLNSTHKHDQ